MGFGTYLADDPIGTEYLKERAARARENAKSFLDDLMENKFILFGIVGVILVFLLLMVIK